MRLFLLILLPASALLTACSNDAEFQITTLGEVFVVMQSSPVITQSSPGFPHPEFSVQCYPETIMPGDTLYVTVVAKNPFDEPIYINDVHYLNKIRIYLQDSEDQIQTHSGIKLQSPNAPPPPEIDISFNFAEINPDDSLVFITKAINAPPLEDLKEPFWEKHLNNLATGDEKFTLCVTFNAYSAKNREPILITLEVPIVMTQRPEREMAQIQKWYKTLVDFLKSEQFQKTGVLDHPSGMPKNITLTRNIFTQNAKASHWWFVRYFNLYPNTSDIPETWQEWKTLEDLLTHSTMRDEIRLTRILIQYCATNEDAVLAELKEWFDDMDEVQRTVLATELRHRAERSYDAKNGHKFLSVPQFREIYKTIREYDKVPIPKDNEFHLRDLGLIE